MSQIDNDKTIKAVNWNAVEDDIDLDVWNRLTSQFWLPEKIALSNDIPSWNTLSRAEQDVVMKVFAGLATLDTLQGTDGAPSMLSLAATPHEEAVFANIAFMEHVHAKSYSSIFTTLADTERINDVFRWAREDEHLQAKAQTIKRFYELSTEFPFTYRSSLMAKAASVLLESFLFYSGFYVAFHWSAHQKLTNSADIIRLILRDEGVHGYYIGYKFQQEREFLSEEAKKDLDEYVLQLALDLSQVEAKYTESVYDEIGWTEDVKTYARYNLNKAMNNLGYDGIFPASQTQVKPSILAQMSVTSDENHDFFSGSGSSYVIGVAEETTDDDWA